MQPLATGRAARCSSSRHQPHRHGLGQQGIYATNRPLHQRHAVVAAALDPSKLVVQVCAEQEYFPAADLHATCFHHSSTPNQVLWDRFERVWALQINDDLAQRGVGNCKLLIAYDPDKAPSDILDRAAPSSSSSSGSSSSSSSELRFPASEAYSFPRLGYWLSRLVHKQVWPGLGQGFEELGIVGVAQVDSFGDLIPPRTLNAERDGAVGWVNREGIAYISNVAVAPSARRCGVAVRLMDEAESLAAAWGCSRAALHCNPANAPALNLYRRLSYKKGVLEAPWMPYLQGRAPDRCYLMLKRLTQQMQRQQQVDAAAAAAAPAAMRRPDKICA